MTKLVTQTTDLNLDELTDALLEKIGEMEFDPELAEKLMAENKRLRSALAKIKKMKPERIAPGFIHGPTLLFNNCQRIAREALKGCKHDN